MSLRLPNNMVVAEGSSEDEISAFIEQQNDPDKFLAFLGRVNKQMVRFFGKKVVGHVYVYHQDDGEKGAELLIGIQSNKRPEDFRFALYDIEENVPDFYDYPVDLCRFIANRKRR